MISTIAVSGYRSLRDVVLPLDALTVVTGANGVGKSSLYEAFRLLADTAAGTFVGSLARRGGLQSVLWAGPEQISPAMRRGDHLVQGTGSRHRPISLQMGFRADDDLSYLIDVGLPALDQRWTMFSRDPEIKREIVWAGDRPRPATLLVERVRSHVRWRSDDGWRQLADTLDPRASLLDEVSEPERFPELTVLRREVGSWRFHDAFRVDAGAPARQPQIGTFSPVLDHDGANLAAAVQTILESAWAGPFTEFVAAALDGSRVGVEEVDGWFHLSLNQTGLLRALSASELSDGTLRVLLLGATLLSPRPPRLLVLNEPESSLHPSVVPRLGALIVEASTRTQVVVVTHSAALVEALTDVATVHQFVKEFGETRIVGQELLSRPPWEWGKRGRS